METISLSLPYAGGAPRVRGVIRACPEDFQVDEVPGFEPSGHGEHVLVHIRKRNANTVWVAKKLAGFAGIHPRDVGYAGLKDRNAVTTQWFSVGLAGKNEPAWSGLASDDIEVLNAVRHHRKLRTGALSGNRFAIVVRDLAGDVDDLSRRLRRIQDEGVPNYFGEQRFGHDNVAQGMAMLTGKTAVRDRFKRGMYLSALRSELFNRVLSERVGQGNWNRAVPGDVMMLDGTHSVFVADEIDEDIERRVRDHDLHPSGPLWGTDGMRPRHAAEQCEQESLRDCREICHALEEAGLVMARRSFRLRVKDLSWDMPARDVLQIHFELPAGAYATTVLREVITA